VKPTYYQRLAEAFKEGAYFISQLLIVLVTFWPVLLLATIGVIILKRLKIKTRKVSG
jgi:hypothetical protein